MGWSNRELDALWGAKSINWPKFARFVQRIRTIAYEAIDGGSIPSLGTKYALVPDWDEG